MIKPKSDIERLNEEQAICKHEAHERIISHADSSVSWCRECGAVLRSGNSLMEARDLLFTEMLHALELMSRWHHDTCDCQVAGKEYECTCGRWAAMSVLAKVKALYKQ